MSWYQVYGIEVKHNYNKGWVWDKVHLKLEVKTKAEAVKAASEFRKHDGCSDVVIVACSSHFHVANRVTAHWRCINTLDGKKFYWKRMIAIDEPLTIRKHPKLRSLQGAVI